MDFLYLTLDLTKLVINDDYSAKNAFKEAMTDCGGRMNPSTNQWEIPNPGSSLQLFGSDFFDMLVDAWNKKALVGMSNLNGCYAKELPIADISKISYQVPDENGGDPATKYYNHKKSVDGTKVLYVLNFSDMDFDSFVNLGGSLITNKHGNISALISSETYTSPDNG